MNNTATRPYHRTVNAVKIVRLNRLLLDRYYIVADTREGLSFTLMTRFDTYAKACEVKNKILSRGTIDLTFWISYNGSGIDTEVKTFGCRHINWTWYAGETPVA